MKEIKKIAKNCGRVERPADGSFDKFSVECNYFKHFLRIQKAKKETKNIQFAQSTPLLL